MRILHGEQAEALAGFYGARQMADGLGQGVEMPEDRARQRANGLGQGVEMPEDGARQRVHRLW